jgi:CubicO group peptidase (beta-lactamase class C family)
MSTEGLGALSAWQRRAVASGQIPSSHVLVWRDGRVVHDHCVGRRTSRAANAPDTIYRFYSMTKPIVSVALMQLYERGRFLLTDPVHLYLGATWKRRNMRVYKSGSYAVGYETEPCRRSITIKDLLTHTSGLSYGFDFLGLENKVDEIYYREGYTKPCGNVAFAQRLAKAPLRFQPGDAFVYGFNSDVVGALVEVLSGQTLDAYLQEHILGPLGMVDTAFFVPAEKYHRFTSLWMPSHVAAYMSEASPSAGTGRGAAAGAEVGAEAGAAAAGAADPLREIDFEWHPDPEMRAKTMKGFVLPKRKMPTWKSGGGGLCGSIYDYARFCEMLMHGGRSSTTGARICSSKTIRFMTRNHLVKGGKVVDFDAMSMPGYTEMTAREGCGFGLGFAVVLDPSLTQHVESEGAYSWGGAASTSFVCDPKENMFVVHMTALRFRDDRKAPIRSHLLQHVYACIDDNAQAATSGGRSEVEAAAERVGLVCKCKL